MNAVLIDSSVLLRMHLPEIGQQTALEFLNYPDLATLTSAQIELLSGLTRAQRRQILIGSEVEKAWLRWQNLLAANIIQLLDYAPYLNKALSFSLQHKHGFNDCLFVMAAKELHLPLVTADRGQAEKALTYGVDVELISD